MAYSKEWQVTREDGTVATRSNTWSPPGSHPVGYGCKVITKDGKLLRIEGDDDNPITTGRVNAMNLALREYTYSPNRVIYPMKREYEDRGKDKWFRISWDQCLDEVCTQVRHFQNTYGQESLVCFGGTGREACIYYYAVTFSVLQSPNCCYTQSGWSCYGPRCSIADYVLGAGYPELDYAGHLPGSYFDPAYTLSKWVVVWGKEPLPSNGDGFFGHCLVDMMKLGTHLISVDPRITWPGSHNGNINLQVRPQTDTAIALGIMNLMFENDEYDHDFAERWIYGLDEIKERAAEYPVDKVSEITTVDAEDIKRAAHIIGTERPIGWAWGLAFDQNKNGVQLSQAFIVLSGLAGSIDRPGGLTLGPPSALLGKWRMEQRGAMTDDIWSLRIGAEAWPGLSTGMATTQPDETLNTLETDEPYALKFGWFNSSNFLVATCSAQPKRWHKALKKLECVVIQDITQTPTSMAVGDYFIPMSTWAEHNSIVLTHYGRNTVFMGPMNKALQVGECMSDLEVCLVFGSRLNPTWWPWYKAEGDTLDASTLEHGEMPAAVTSDAGRGTFDYAALERGVEKFNDDQLSELGFNWKTFQELGLYQPGAHGFEYEKYEKGLLRFDNAPGFNTITGQIEAYSILYESWGEDPLPYYEEPNYSPVSRPQDAELYPLISSSGARRYSSFHSEHRHVPSLRQIDPWPWVQINPKTAEEYEVTDGDWVEVYNMFGEGRFKAEITECMKPGILMCAHGWWFPEQSGEEPNLFGVFKSNFNTMVPHFGVGKLGFGAPYKGMMCNLRRVRGLNTED